MIKSLLYPITTQKMANLQNTFTLHKSSSSASLIVLIIRATLWNVYIAILT